MCGIAGSWAAPERGARSRDVVRGMLNALRHRGPDDEGLWEAPAAGVVLGQRRLAIIDLSPGGHQPMLTPDGRYAVTMNGEIYNYRELRAEHQAAGVVFRSRSDTEVLLEGYRHWGIAVLERLVGMFAFALWDGPRHALLLARDRAGEKPLYYARLADGGFAFASECGPLAALEEVDRARDPDALSLYLRYQYVPAPHTMWRGIRKLAPGHVLEVHEGNTRVWRYWDPLVHAASTASRPASLDEALERLDDLLRQSVRGQMLADVPLGAFLSGGIDSSLLVAYMQEVGGARVRTFTVGFDVPAFDESAHAGAVAQHLGTDHTVEYLGVDAALNVVPRVPQMYDEPFADSSALPTHLVSAVARQHVTVSLSGDGADELFGGYSRYRFLQRVASPFASLSLLGGILRRAGSVLPDPAPRIAAMVGKTPAEQYRALIEIFSAEDVQALAGGQAGLPEFDRAWTSVRGSSPARHARLADIVTYLPEDILTKVDRAAMAVSLETRAPFLDHRVMEFALSLPDEWTTGKLLLKTLLYRRVPRALLDRPKKGFGVPLATWFRGPLRSLLVDALSAAALRHAGVQDTRAAARMLAEHLSGRRNHAHRLWALFVLSMWADANAG